jgi:hypothetical protein
MGLAGAAPFVRFDSDQPVYQRCLVVGVMAITIGWESRIRRKKLRKALQMFRSLRIMVKTPLPVGSNKKTALLVHEEAPHDCRQAKFA